MAKRKSWRSPCRSRSRHAADREEDREQGQSLIEWNVARQPAYRQNADLVEELKKALAKRMATARARECAGIRDDRLDIRRGSSLKKIFWPFRKRKMKNGSFVKKNKGRALSDEATALDEDEVSPETPFLTDDSFESITDQVPEHIYDSVVEYENVLHLCDQVGTIDINKLMSEHPVEDGKPDLKQMSVGFVMGFLVGFITGHRKRKVEKIRRHLPPRSFPPPVPPSTTGTPLV